MPSSIKTLIFLGATIAAESLPVAMKVYSDGRERLMKEPSNRGALMQTAVGGGLLALSFHFAKESARLEQVTHGTDFIKTTVRKMLDSFDKKERPTNPGGVPADLDAAADVWPTPPMPPVAPRNVEIRTDTPFGGVAGVGPTQSQPPFFSNTKPSPPTDASSPPTTASSPPAGGMKF